MIQQLYNIFKEKWFNEWKVERIFLYSDLHLKGNGASLDQDAINIRKFFNYASDELQIENINRQLNKNDLFICLGDVGDQNQISKIKAKRKILIKGNHDSGDSNYTNFDEVISGICTISDRIVLSHEPMVKELKSLGLFNICGHIHNQFEIDKLHEEGYNNFLCISANLHNYEPINLGDLFNRKNEFKDFKGLSECQGIHRIVIDKAVARKQQRKDLSKFETI